MLTALQSLSPEYFLTAKFAAYAALGVCGIGLVALGRMTRRMRVGLLLAAFALFALPEIPSLGVPFAMHPSPICVTGKLPAMYVSSGMVSSGMLAGLIVLLVFSWPVNKVFCGSICPLGAAQELVGLIPLPRALKRLRGRIPFRYTNGLRLALLLSYASLLLATGINLYDYMNGFHLFHWELVALSVIPGLVALMLSVVLWRPFCLMVCPLGLMSWALERVAPIKIRIVPSACTRCGICERGMPCQAAMALRDGKVGEDCFTCGRCMEICPSNAFYFGTAGKSKAAGRGI